ncbi:MAG: hypothetical protein HY320_01710, partial [Armatimonadetes bacterium]|nr:hypothetical protein [Armatimonadota bacterium]
MLLAALEDLYGWTVEQESGRRWLLDRPRLSPARDARDLHRKVAAALPPSLRLMFRAHHRPPEGFVNWWSRHHRRLMGDVHRARKPGWTRFPVAEMSASLPRKLSGPAAASRQPGVHKLHAGDAGALRRGSRAVLGSGRAGDGDVHDGGREAPEG